MAADAASLPSVQLNRMQSLRLVAVGLIVAFMLLRVVPDVYRLFVPLGAFDYATDDDGAVVKAPAVTPKGSDKLLMGDRVRIDRIRPFDRKPGLARVGYTQQNFDRWLPIERDGRERVRSSQSGTPSRRRAARSCCCASSSTPWPAGSVRYCLSSIPRSRRSPFSSSPRGFGADVVYRRDVRRAVARDRARDRRILSADKRRSRCCFSRRVSPSTARARG